MKQSIFVLSVALTTACGPGGSADRWDPISPFVAGRDARADGDDSGDAHDGDDGDDGEIADAVPGPAPIDPTAPIDANGPNADATEAPTATDAAARDADSARDPAASDGRTSDGPESGAPLADAAAARGCPGDGCKRIFVTSTGVPDGAFGSLAGADAVCQSLAETAALGGGWWAWISDATGSPSSRFLRSKLPYLLVDGTRVAASWDALTSGVLARPIDVFETGRAVPFGRVFEVWTGTTPGGRPSESDCAIWSSDSSVGQTGSVGLTNRSDRGWTQAYAQFCDRRDLHLYCVEQ